MSSSKKHHFVPQMLLRRFAYDGLLWHMPIDRDDLPRRTAPKEIGHVNGGHTLITRDGTPDRDSLEREMGLIESAASTAISEVVAAPAMAEVPPDIAAPIAWLASLQIARSRSVLGYLAESLRSLPGQERDADAGTMFETQTSLLRATTTSVLSSWSLRDYEYARPKEQWDYVANCLLNMRWDVMRYPDRSLAVSDAFAAQYGIRDDVGGDFERSPSMAKYGLMTPLWAAKGCTIALTPNVALSLHHSAQRKSVAAAAVNMHTIRSARSFIAFPADFNPADVMPGWVDWIVEARGVRQALPKSL